MAIQCDELEARLKKVEVYVQSQREAWEKIRRDTETIREQSREFLQRCGHADLAQALYPEAREGGEAV